MYIPIEKWTMDSLFPEAENFFLCMSLKTGSYIIGSLELIFSFLVAIEDVTIIKTHADSKLLRMLYWTDVAMLSMQTLAAIVLLIGLKRSNRNYIDCWILTHCGLAFFVVANFIGTVPLIPALKLKGKFRFVLYSFIFTLRTIVLYAFCLVIVNSYNKTLKKVSRKSSRKSHRWLSLFMFLSFID